MKGLVMGNTAQTLNAIILNLRNLFKNKDRLVGVDDWDNFIGCLCALEEIEANLQEQKEESLVEE